MVALQDLPIGKCKSFPQVLNEHTLTIKPTIFSDLAHQLVHACMASLLKASDRIKSETSLVDGQLFLIKHLLILKEQMIAFDIEYVQPQPHLQKKEEESTISVTGRLTETLWGFYEKGSFFGGSTLGKLVGAGSVEGAIDAKVVRTFCVLH